MVVPLLTTQDSSSLGVSVRWYKPIRHKRLIHDVTLPWDETMLRPWLELEVNDTIVHYGKESLPSVMILLTTSGWNQPNQTEGRTFAHPYVNENCILVLSIIPSFTQRDGKILRTVYLKYVTTPTTMCFWIV